MSNTTTNERAPEGDDLPYVVRLAIPNKGRISIPILELMEKSGLHLLDAGERRLISRTPDPHIEVLFARPIDIPEYVATGAADMGITGHDMVAERGVQVDELLDLQFGRATLVLAVQEGSPAQSVNDLMDAKIATEFPGIAQSYFAENNIPVHIVQVGGACEATPYLGIADAIIDLSSSGDTLRSNRLRVISEVMKTSTVVIANRDARAAKVREGRRDRAGTGKRDPCPRAVLPDDERPACMSSGCQAGAPRVVRADRDGSCSQRRPCGRACGGKRGPGIPPD